MVPNRSIYIMNHKSYFFPPNHSWVHDYASTLFGTNLVINKKLEFIYGQHIEYPIQRYPKTYSTNRFAKNATIIKKSFTVAKFF